MVTEIEESKNGINFYSLRTQTISIKHSITHMIAQVQLLNQLNEMLMLIDK